MGELRPERDPITMIKSIAEFLIPKGIYRVQRNQLEVYPPVNLPDHEIEIVSILFNQFETVWKETYGENPYAFMTNGEYIEGLNSELTFHVNPLEAVIYANYNIQQSSDENEAVGYPITINMPVQTERPLIWHILYFEAIGRYMNEDVFYDSSIYRIAKRFPDASVKWEFMKKRLQEELQYGLEQEYLDEDDVAVWNKGMQENEVVLKISDEDAMHFPTIAIYGGEHQIEGKNYALKASASLMEGAFAFRHDRYVPFKNGH